MYNVFFIYIHSAPQNVNRGSTAMTTTNERKTVVLYFGSSQVGNWLYTITYNMTAAVILWQILL